jgi:hypothetical protein
MDLSPRFKDANFLNKNERIEKALKNAEIYETDKFDGKKKFIFRAPDPLKSSPKALK